VYKSGGEGCPFRHTHTHTLSPRYLFLPDFYRHRPGVDGSKPGAVRAAEARLGKNDASRRAWGVHRFANYVAARAEVGANVSPMPAVCVRACARACVHGVGGWWVVGKGGRGGRAQPEGCPAVRPPPPSH
jgi:hypothetical protein